MNKPQLFCFTYAGGNSAFFDEISQDLMGFEVVAPEYPGHGIRRKEKPYDDFCHLADEVFNMCQDQYNGGKYALLGYSMGTITLVEVLRRIQNCGMRQPDYVFLAAHEPHTKSELTGFESGELDEMVKQRTIAFGAVPEQLWENKSFWRMYLPLYRADYTMIGKYRFDELKLISTVPAVVFYSESDTPLKDMKDWQKIFTVQCDFYEFSGKHFFIREHHQEIAKIIQDKMLLDMR